VRDQVRFIAGWCRAFEAAGVSAAATADVPAPTIGIASAILIQLGRQFEEAWEEERSLTAEVCDGDNYEDARVTLRTSATETCSGQSRPH
jgi:hypothetical protein